MARTLVLALLLAGCATSPANPASPAPPAPAPAPTLVVPEPTNAPADDDPPAPGRSAIRSTPSGLQVEELALGSGVMAEPGKRVRLHYVGTLEDGTVFDSTRERGTPFEAELGKGHLIKGFEEGVAGMKVGGLRRLTIPPELGYGDRATAKIPANATLIFEVELLEVR